MCQEFDARMACVHVNTTKYMETIETKSEASERINALLPLQLGIAISYQYESAYHVSRALRG